MTNFLKAIIVLFISVLGASSSQAQDPYAELVYKELERYVDVSIERTTDFFLAYDRQVLNLASQALYQSMTDDKVIWTKTFSNGSFTRESSIKKNEVLHCSNSVTRQPDQVEVAAQCVSNEILAVPGQVVFLNSTAQKVAQGFNAFEAKDLVRPLFRRFVISQAQADHINQNYEFKLRKSIRADYAQVTLEVQTKNYESTKKFMPNEQFNIQILDCAKNRNVYQNWFGEFDGSPVPKAEYSCVAATAANHRDVMRLAQWLFKTAAAK